MLSRRASLSATAGLSCFQMVMCRRLREALCRLLNKWLTKSLLVTTLQRGTRAASDRLSRYKDGGRFASRLDYQRPCTRANDLLTRFDEVLLISERCKSV